MSPIRINDGSGTTRNQGFGSAHGEMNKAFLHSLPNFLACYLMIKCAKNLAKNDEKLCSTFIKPIYRRQFQNYKHCKTWSKHQICQKCGKKWRKALFKLLNLNSFFDWFQIPDISITIFYSTNYKKNALQLLVFLSASLLLCPSVTYLGHSLLVCVQDVANVFFHSHQELTL